jgi:hypothetical protein
MKFWSTCLFIFALALLTSCETTKPKTEKTDIPHETNYRAASFEIKQPTGITTAVEQGDGFAVHYFKTANSKSMLGIYEGQRPRLFSKKEHNLTVMRRTSTVRDNIDRGDDVWGIDSNGGIWRESVWSCTRTVIDNRKKIFKLPSIIHIWYFGATEEEAALFDSMLDSLVII